MAQSLQMPPFSPDQIPTVRFRLIHLSGVPWEERTAWNAMPPCVTPLPGWGTP